MCVLHACDTFATVPCIHTPPSDEQPYTHTRTHERHTVYLFLFIRNVFRADQTPGCMCGAGVSLFSKRAQIELNVWEHLQSLGRLAHRVHHTTAHPPPRRHTWGCADKCTRCWRCARTWPRTHCEYVCAAVAFARSCVSVCVFFCVCCCWPWQNVQADAMKLKCCVSTVIY